MAENAEPFELTMSPETVVKSTEKDMANFHGENEIKKEASGEENEQFRESKYCLTIVWPGQLSKRFLML